MAVPFGPVAGESNSDALGLDFDRRIKLHFHGAKLSSDGGLLLFRELDEALGLTEMAGWELRDRRAGRNTQHSLLALFRQSVFGRLAGYEDVNDADRLSRDPVMHSIVAPTIATLRARARWAASRPAFCPTSGTSRR